MLRNIKKITLASFLLGALVGTVQAQTCGSTSNGISTNPTNPTNPLCPSRLNTFDWMSELWPLGWMSGLEIPSPFHNESWCADAATGLGILREGFQSDFKPEDGWELLTTTVNNRTASRLNLAYTVLYNRYTSVIRILFVTNENSRTINYKALKLLFEEYGSSKLSALFWPAARQYSQAMDQKSNPAVLQLTLAPNVNECYMYFDIPVEYDPCTCFNQADTKIQFS